jgi:murein DD-endopeptidase MepM/ murein hydrolase activator NlpD
MPSLRTTFTSFTAVVTFAAGGYQPPVDAPIVDPFRAPRTPWAAGNRGIEYATRPGTRVGAAADGAVVFAGMVAGSLHVVVRHADGVRTSYSFLRTALVHRGDRVARGEPVGTSGDRLHFGARIGDDYIDPALLFGDMGPPRVRLVPDRDAPAGGVPMGLRATFGSRAALGPHSRQPTRPPSQPGVLQRAGKPW